MPAEGLRLSEAVSLEGYAARPAEALDWPLVVQRAGGLLRRQREAQAILHLPIQVSGHVRLGLPGGVRHSALRRARVRRLSRDGRLERNLRGHGPGVPRARRESSPRHASETTSARRPCRPRSGVGRRGTRPGRRNRPER